VLVSVDGARPALEMAKKYEMRYIHVPIGYDGIDSDAAKSFAQVACEIDQKMYVHCHHGKHRGPAAVAIVAIEQGVCDSKEALKILKTVGTSKKYGGLWRDISEYKAQSPSAKLPQLVSECKLDSLVVAMAKIDRDYDLMKLCADANWQKPVTHPDLDPDQQILIFREGLHECGRLYSGGDLKLVELYKNSEELAFGIESALDKGDKKRASKLFKEVKASCTACHNRYRN